MPKAFIGRTIKDIRRMTPTEAKREGWDQRAAPLVVVLDDDSLLYASRDAEGNGPGVLFAYDASNRETIGFRPSGS